MVEIDLEQEIVVARQTKEQMDWDDLMPMLVLRKGDNIIIGALAVDKPYWGQVIEQMLTQERPDVVLFIVDGYSLSVHGSQDDPMAPDIHLEPGELGRRWEAGDREGITEHLSVIAYNGTDMVSIHQPYDAETRTWSEPRTTKDYLGAVPDMLVHGWHGHGLPFS